MTGADAAPRGPDRGELRCWRIPLDRPPPPAAAQSLSADEHRRAATFATAALRRRFVATRAAVRRILADSIGVPPEAVRIAVEPHGRPVLAMPESVAGPERAAVQAGGVDFSLSHSGDLALLAVTRGRRVGVDVESAARAVDSKRLAPRVFAREECRWMAAAGPACAGERFLRLWTAKEAMLKATGWGLYLDPRSVAVDWDARRGRVAPGFPTAEAAAPDSAAESASHWHLSPIEIARGWTSSPPPNPERASRPAREEGRRRRGGEAAAGGAWIATVASERPFDTLAVFEFRWTEALER